MHAFCQTPQARVTATLTRGGRNRKSQQALGNEARDNLTSITDLQTAANNQTFTYTPRESLATATGPYGAMTFTYDGVGNRVTYKLGAATDSYTYPGASNRLGTIALAAGGSRAFTDDAAGNVTLDNRTGGGYGYTYNSAGRLSEFRVNGVLQASYKYDALGRQAIRSLSPQQPRRPPPAPKSLKKP